MKIERYLTPQIRRDLRKKMVFVGGARQVGKTTLARSLLRRDRGYLSWDVPEHRERILKEELPSPSTRLWVFDEIHKYRRWRSFLKGLYDRPGLRQADSSDGERTTGLLSARRRLPSRPLPLLAPTPVHDGRVGSRHAPGAPEASSRNRFSRAQRPKPRDGRESVEPG